MESLPFWVGASMLDITPPLEVGILMSAVERRWAPFQRVRQPLYARAIAIERGTHRVVLVSLDLLGLASRALGGKMRFKRRVVVASERVVTDSDLVLAATHAHSAPSSLAITDLYRTAAFKEWTNLLIERVGRAIRQAMKAMRPCSLATGTTHISGLSIYRRIRTTDGVVLSHPPPPPEKVISRDGPVDDTVNVAAFTDASSELVALVVNATCHPVHEMCIPQVSPDYPGEMSLELERCYPGAVALFFNGAAGNINPPTVSGGAGDAQRHGRRLAGAVNEALSHANPVDGEIALKRMPITLPARTLSGRPAARPMKTEIAALGIGDAAFLFLPGEPFVEIGLAIRENSPYSFTAVIGYAEDWIGYIPTDQAFGEGGYELGPGPWAKVGYGSEGILQSQALRLLNETKISRMPDN
jgi:neutral ceramidase